LTVQGQKEVKTFISENDLRSGKVTFDADQSKIKSKSSDPTRLKIVSRAAKEVSNGMYVNLGIGIPTLLPSVLPNDVHITLESENGVLGVGPYPPIEEASGRNINAGKVSIFLSRKRSL